MKNFELTRKAKKFWENYLIAFALNIPKLEEDNILTIVGWVLGKKYPALKLQIKHGDKVIQEIPINKPRPQVAEKYPDITYARKSGFKCELNIRKLPLEWTLDVVVVLEDNSKVIIGEINWHNFNEQKEGEIQEIDESNQLELLSQKIVMLQIELKKLNEELVQESRKRKQIELILDSYKQFDNQKSIETISYSRKIANRLIAYSNNFARDHHMACPEKKFIYCFIPKNACTTFKNVTHIYSDDNKVKVQGFAIHAEDQQQKILAETQHLLDNTYFKFVILRNPFLRLVSAYYDKFVRADPKSLEKFAKNVVEKIKGKDKQGISFQEFVEYLYETRSNLIDQHWRCQLDFLIFDEYDMYLQFEKLDTDIPKLEQALDIKVPRENVAGHTTQYSKVKIDKPWSINSVELRNLLELTPTSRLIYPHPHQMFNDDLIAKINYRYKGDIELYESLYGRITLTL